jgi:integrase
VKVYAGVDPVTKRELYLRELVKAKPTRRETERLADKALTKLLNQVDERRNPRTTATVNQLIDRWLDLIELERTTRTAYIGKIEKHVRPTIGKVPVARLDAETIDALYASLRRCRDHCNGRKFIAHRTKDEHVCDEHNRRRKCAKVVRADPTADCKWCQRACGPHACRPLAIASIRVVHAILSGALTRAVRWGWIAVNPLDQVEPPATPTANPKPPTSAEAARIVSAAWDEPEWGTLVWLAMITGARRGELSGLRWTGLDLDGGVVTFARSIGQISGEMWEKDTKTHQTRRVTLDSETVEILRDHRRRCDERAASLGLAVRPDGFVFSLRPDCSKQIRPDTITQRYGRLAKRLGIDTTLHALRHYSATELIAAGVDPRTVAGRLGHAGGGSTTLRVYSAWVAEADQRAAAALAARMTPMRQRASANEPDSPDTPPAPVS